MQAGWHLFLLLLSWGGRHIKKPKAGEHPNQFDCFFMALVLFLLAPGIYLCCLAVFDC